MKDFTKMLLQLGFELKKTSFSNNNKTPKFLPLCPDAKLA
jgi:hypothetical protein